MNNIINDRKISKKDYLDQLQKEYILSSVRSKIYYKKNDKLHWKKVADLKKTRIDGIGDELGLPTIFNSNALFLKYFHDFKNEGGMPKFFYKQNDSDDLKKYDLINYYSLNSQIKVVSDNSIGVIVAAGEEFIARGVVEISTDNGFVGEIELNKIVRLI